MDYRFSAWKIKSGQICDGLYRFLAWKIVVKFAIDYRFPAWKIKKMVKFAIESFHIPSRYIVIANPIGLLIPCLKNKVVKFAIDTFPNQE